MNPKSKKGLISIFVIVLAATTVLLIRSYVLTKLKASLNEKLKALDESDFKVQYDTLYMQWAKNLIVVDNLVITKDSYDTTCVHPEFISTRKLQVKGFHWLKLLFSQEVNVDEIVLDNPHMVIRKHSTFFLDSVAKDSATGFALTIGRLQLDSAHIEYTDSSSCILKNEFYSTIQATGITFSIQHTKPFEFALSNLRMNGTRLRFPDEYYSVTIHQTEYNSSEEWLTLDSIKIIPHLSKLDFGHRKGYDIDRIEGLIPYVKLHGLSYRYQDTLAFRIRSLATKMYLHIFHDKRLPHKNIKKPLPVQLLRQMPFGLTIDSLNVDKSYISYEEFAPASDAPGSIFFDNIRALITRVNNDPHLEEGETTMDARADFMGKGDLTVHTVFPWRDETKCLMKGTLKSFPFPEINPMLKPATPLEIESGVLDQMPFSFTYTNEYSQGEVSLIYHDLKVTLYKDPSNETGSDRKKKKNDDEEKKDNFKTLIINAFIIRKNMDGDLPEEKRTGMIYFERNQTRSIFNYWWKSLFSGIQSAFHLDRLKAKKSKHKK
jgi:hypothetical protein